jgi:alpha-amylase
VSSRYAFILTHPGLPAIFWPDWQQPSANAAIEALIQLRATSGVGANSPKLVVEQGSGLYAAYIGNNAAGSVAACEGVLAVKLGPSLTWSPCGDGWVLRQHGNNFAVWTRSAQNPIVNRS